MAIGYLLVKINSQRVLNNSQPEEESISVSSFLSFPDKLDYNLVETERFSDYLDQGKFSGRYIHLMGLTQGICIAMLENYLLAPSDHSFPHFPQRLIGGIYDHRELIISDKFVKLSTLDCADDIRSSGKKFLSISSICLIGQISYNGVCDRFSICCTVNCIESFDHVWKIYSSLKLPLYVFSAAGVQRVAAVAEQLQNLATKNPIFANCEIDIADVKLQVDVEKSDFSNVKAVLLMGRGDDISISVDSLSVCYG